MSYHVYRMLLWLLAGALFYNTAPVLWARQDSTGVRSDTTYLLPGVVVTARRPGSVGTRTLSPVTTIAESDLQQTGASQVGEVLSFVPGVFVRNYGGLGGLKTVSLRGTSAAQTAVLLDGVRLNSSQNGLVDLSTLPVGIVEEIEVVRGGESALFGASAVGGTINIRSVSFHRETTVRMQSSVGSFGEVGAGGTLRFSADSAMILFAGDYRTSQGDYPFLFNQFGSTTTVRRSNGGFHALSGVLGLAAQTGSWQWRGHLIARSTERGSPGAVVQGSIEEEQARLAEDDLLAILHAERGTDGATSLALTASGRANRFRYNDPGASVFGAQGIDETFYARDATLAARMQFLAWSQLNELQAEAGIAELRGAMLQPGVGPVVSRRTLSLAGRMERSLEAGGQEIVVQAALRLDHYSDAGTAVSPLLATSWRPGVLPLAVLVQWAYNFRPPSFNELYYLNFGTAGLQPERSHSLNAGVRWTVADGIDADIHSFLIHTSDKIVAVPVSPATWNARSVGAVQTRGVECSASGVLWDGLLRFSGAWTLQQSLNRSGNPATDGKDLAYIPRSLLSASVATRVWQVEAGVQALRTGERYSLDGNAPDALLPPFTTVGLFAGLHITPGPLSVDVRIFCDNMFDERYSVIRNYPMPGRSFRGTVDVRF